MQRFDGVRPQACKLVSLKGKTMLKIVLTALALCAAPSAMAQTAPAPRTKIKAVGAKAPTAKTVAKVMGISVADAKLIIKNAPYKNLKAAAAQRGLSKAGKKTIGVLASQSFDPLGTLQPKDKAKIRALIDD